MAIIAHLIGITLFGALAASGFVLTVQIMYWVGLVAAMLLMLLQYSNAGRGIKRLDANKALPVDIEKILPHLRNIDFDSRCVHVIFANVIHATIALYLLHAPILAAAIILEAVVGVVTAQKFKEMIKRVNDDPRYQ